MKKIFSIFLISFFSIVILSGCQAVKKKSEKIIKKEDDMLSKFLGRSIEELKNDMGQPSETHYSDNGNKVLIYKTTKYTVLCERKFEVSDANTVIKYSSNGCI